MFLGRRLKLRRWWDYIDDQVIVGAFPFAKDVPGLAKEGIRAVVNTCEEYGGPIAAYELAGIEQLHIPTTDFTPPLLKDVEKAVEFVIKNVDDGHAVYIHCKAGRARSATVAICYLMRRHGWTAEQAQLRLLERRPHIHPTLDRRQVVRDYYDKYVKHQPASETVEDKNMPPASVASEVLTAEREVLEIDADRDEAQANQSVTTDDSKPMGPINS